MAIIMGKFHETKQDDGNMSRPAMAIIMGKVY